MQKIYLTYKEIETLCFFKQLEINKDICNFKRAVKNRCYYVEVIDGSLIEKNNMCVILFSSVHLFDIPKTELNLFKNQFKIPLGLLHLSKRGVKDEVIIEEMSNTNKSEVEKDYKNYASIRRSLVEIYLWNKNDDSHDVFIDKLNKLVCISGFTKSLISSVLENKTYPKLEIDTGKYEKLSFYQYVWWGKFIVDKILEPLKDKLSEKEYLEHRKWFKLFNTEDIEKNREAIKSMPKLYMDNYAVILGYFFAIMTQDSIPEKGIGCAIDNHLKNIRDVNDEYAVLFWGLFFQSLFIEDIDYKYPNPLIVEEFISIEKIVLNFVSILNVDKPLFDEIKLNNSTLDRSDLARKYIELKELHISKNLKVLNKKEVLSPFMDSSLSRINRDKVGLINGNLSNSVNFNDTGFEFIGNKSNVPVTYYGDILSEQNELLKCHGIVLKRKPLAALLNNRKRVIVGFYNGDMSMLSLYRKILESSPKHKIKNIVLIWIVDEEASSLLTTEFANDRNSELEKLKEYFCMNVTLIVKNKRELSSNEIERNLKLSLKGVSVNQIELIDSNLTEERAEWIINATNDYVLIDDDIDYRYYSTGYSL